VAVLVHNADGVNPYGTEIAALLHEAGHAVTVVDASNAEHRPPAGVAWRRLLPSNFGQRTKLGQLQRLTRGLGATAWASLVRGDVVVVTSVVFPVETIALAGLGALGRPVVLVQHDPVRRRAESRLSRWGRRQVLLRSTVAVVHSERLRAEVEPAAWDHVVVCPHPPYRVATSPPLALERVDDRRWVAFIGALRRDKGIALVPEIMARVPEGERRRLGLVVCGRGELSEEFRARIDELGVALRDMTSPVPVEHDVLVGVLAERPLLLAPYVAATQSGSVILALSVGCRVLAFDKGGIPDVVTRDGLVPNGDLDAVAAALAEGRSGTSRLPLHEWAATARDCWSAAVDQARTRSRTPAGRLKRAALP
jgi:glycosyltransferase involved in cell wall biosynthesis